MPAASPEDVTLGEVHRLLELTRDENNRRFDEVDRRFDAVNRRISGLNVVHRDTYDSDQGAVKGRLVSLEESDKTRRNWLAGGLVTLLATVGGNVAYLLVHTK